MSVEPVDPMTEVLLTVWAASQERQLGDTPMSHIIPKRLASTFRKARKLGYVTVDDDGMYLDELGSSKIISFRI